MTEQPETLEVSKEELNKFLETFPHTRENINKLIEQGVLAVKACED